jgi:hypothetical protein
MNLLCSRTERAFTKIADASKIEVWLEALESV